MIVRGCPLRERRLAQAETAMTAVMGDELRILWQLWIEGRTLRAEIHPHFLGWELRIYGEDYFRYSSIHKTPDRAELRADRMKRNFLAEGWRETPIQS
jgi:hypothetical protein